MANEVSFLETEEKPTLEELRTFYQEHDFTLAVASIDEQTEADDAVWLYKKAGEIFSSGWERLLGSSTYWKNHSADHPVIALREADKKVIANAVVGVRRNKEALTAFTDTGAKIMLDRFERDYPKYLTGQQIIEDDVSEEDWEKIFEKVVDDVFEDAVHLLQQVQNTSAVIDVCKEYKTREDYNEHKVSWAQIDFYRSWSHSQTKVGKMLPIDELNEKMREDVSATRAIERVVDDLAYQQIRDAFSETLDETDRRIFYMLERGKTQVQIAEELGFASQSSVSKRFKKMKDKFLMFLLEET